jgi:hypothetical protein
VNAYSEFTADPVGIHVMYTLPNGDFLPFSADTHNGANDSTVFSSPPTYNSSNTTWSGTQDPLYNVWGGSPSGNFHVHVGLKAEGGDTDSYQVSSSQITIAPGATTPTWSASGGLGHHIRVDASTGKPMVAINGINGNASDVTFAKLSPAIYDGTADGTAQYQGFTFALHNASQSPVTVTITWTCDPSVWGTNGTAPTFLQASPPATVQSGTAVDYRFTTLGFPAATYGVKSGALPTGLSLDINGDLTGTPTTPGVYSFTVGATNSVNGVVTNTINMTVQ